MPELRVGRAIPVLVELLTIAPPVNLDNVVTERLEIFVHPIDVGLERVFGNEIVANPKMLQGDVVLIRAPIAWRVVWVGLDGLGDRRRAGDRNEANCEEVFPSKIHTNSPIRILHLVLIWLAARNIRWSIGWTLRPTAVSCYSLDNKPSQFCGSCGYGLELWA
jgi:hypothetical protein